MFTLINKMQRMALTALNLALNVLIFLSLVVLW